MLFYVFFFLLNLLALGSGVWLAIRHEEELRHRQVVFVKEKNKIENDAVAKSMSENSSDSKTTVITGESITDETTMVSDTSDHDNHNLIDKDIVKNTADASAENDIDDMSENEVENTEETIDLPTPLREFEQTDEIVSETLEADVSNLVNREQYNEVLPISENAESGEISSVIQEPKSEFDEIVVDEILQEIDENMPEMPHEGSFISLPVIEDVVTMISEGDITKDDLLIIQQLHEIHDLLASFDQRHSSVEDAEAFVTSKIARYASIAFCRPVIRRHNCAEKKTKEL